LINGNTQYDKVRAVLREYGLGDSATAIIGADKPPGSTEWMVMMGGGANPEHLGVDTARRLASDLARVGEMMLSQRLATAADTAQRMMQPRVER
jgi:hypothetical protein